MLIIISLVFRGYFEKDSKPSTEQEIEGERERSFVRTRERDRVKAFRFDIFRLFKKIIFVIKTPE